ncbi:hypothetical protein PO909_019832 [Leuciscus waleckii]
MEIAAQFAALVQSGLPIADNTLQFCLLTVHSGYDDETSLPQSPAISATQLSLSPINPSVPPLPPLSSMAPTRTCREPSPPGHEEPEVLPPALVRYALPRPIALAPALALFQPSTSAWAIRPRRTPSACLLHLGQTSLCLHCGLADHPLLSGPPPLRLLFAGPYLRFCLRRRRSNLPLDLQIPTSISGGRRCGSIAASKIFAISPPPRLIGAQWPPSTPSLSPVIPMAPPSINTDMGHSSGCGLDEEPLG